MNGYGQCPRCGAWAVEHLRTHTHCWECSYFPEEDTGLSEWRKLEFRKLKVASSHRHSNDQLVREEARLQRALMLAAIL